MSPLFGSAGPTDSTDPAAALDGAAANGGPPPAGAPPEGLQGVSALVSARPELIVGAAFAGGLLLAVLVRRLGR